MKFLALEMSAFLKVKFIMKSYYFNITYKCNSNCVFCAANSRENTNDLPYVDLEKKLFQMNVQAGDRIIINGGEPTLHGDLLKILELVKKINCYPLLFTNGVKLDDESFVKKILENAPMKILIPLFSTSEKEHDFLTGKKGNFLKTINALSNLIFYKNKGIKVLIEIKLLVSKITYKNNIHIVKMIKELFPDTEGIQFSLNQLILSPSVLKNKELFVKKYHQMSFDTLACAKYILKSYYKLILGLPICLFKESYELFIPNKKYREIVSEYYIDSKREHKVDQINNDLCSACSFSSFCVRFNDDYLQYVGNNEIIPFV